MVSPPCFPHPPAAELPNKKRGSRPSGECAALQGGYPRGITAGKKNYILKKMEKIKKKDSWVWYRVFGRVLGAVGAAGPRAGACRAALAAGVPDTGRGFFIYIYKNTFFSPWVCFEKGLGNNED